MATIEDLEALERAGHLFRVRVPLRSSEIEIGRVYLTKEAAEFIDKKTSRKRDRKGFSEYERLFIIMKDIILDRRIDRGEGHPCRPREFRVWELKKGATRIFGYFPFRQVFIGVCGALKGIDLPDEGPSYSPFIQVAKTHYEANRFQPISETSVNAVL